MRSSSVLYLMACYKVFEATFLRQGERSQSIKIAETCNRMWHAIFYIYNLLQLQCIVRHSGLFMKYFLFFGKPYLFKNMYFYVFLAPENKSFKFHGCFKISKASTQTAFLCRHFSTETYPNKTSNWAHTLQTQILSWFRNYDPSLQKNSWICQVAAAKADPSSILAKGLDPTGSQEFIGSDHPNKVRSQTKLHFFLLRHFAWL